MTTEEAEVHIEILEREALKLRKILNLIQDVYGITGRDIIELEKRMSNENPSHILP